MKELRAELEAGQKTLAELESKEKNLRNTLLRISGAIKVLEEELAKENGEEKGKKSGVTRKKWASLPRQEK